jgi:predicted secreted protein
MLSVNLADDKQTYRLAVGDEILVCLPEKLTGYRWVFESASTNIYTSEESKLGTSGVVSGNGGFRCWRIKTVSPGEVELVFVSTRPWERSSPGQKFSIKIEVY